MKNFCKWKQQTMEHETNRRWHSVGITHISAHSFVAFIVVSLLLRFVSFLYNFSVSLQIELQFLLKPITFMVFKCKTLTHESWLTFENAMQHVVCWGMNNFLFFFFLVWNIRRYLGELQMSITMGITTTEKSFIP